MEMHYCKGELKDISFVGHSTCGTCDNNKPKCKMHKGKKSCCETTTIIHDAEEDYLSNTIDINQITEILPIVICFNYNYTVFIDETIEKQVFKAYSPPEVDKDIALLVQSFLI